MGAMTHGSVYFIAYAANSLAFWYGARLILEGRMVGGIGSVFAVIFIVIDSEYLGVRKCEGFGAWFS